ncbi:MAG: integrase family protein [Sphingomicrobium sp.]
MAKLSKTFVDKVQPPASGHVVHWDGGHDRAVKGFGLRVSSLGKRVFVVAGRVRGKQLQFTIGPYGQFTEDEARSKARRILQQMREGTDPRDVKKADEAAKITLQQVCDAYTSRPGKLKDSSKDEMRRHVAKVFADWQHRPIAEITESQVKKRYRDMATKGLTGKPAPGQANISMTTLRALINYAARQYKRADGSPLITHNPVGALRDDWIQLKPRTRDIDTNKVGAVWHMLTTARSELIAAQQREDGRINPQDADKQAGVDLALFLMLTGARRNEGAKLQWRNVNLDEGWFHLPDPKNANPVWLPLSSQARALLAARPRLNGNPHVFASRGKAGHVMDTRAPLRQISELAGTTLSAHDLRRTYVSVGVTVCDVDLHKIELLTNHVPKGVTAKHYLQTSRLQYLEPEVERIGTWMEEQGRIAEAKANGANVVPLRA